MTSSSTSLNSPRQASAKETAHERVKDPAQWLALVLVVTIPLVPRPTFPGPSSVIAPTIVVLMAALAVVHSLVGRADRRSVLNSGVFGAMLLATVIYGARVGWNGERAEVSFVVSRILFLLLIVSICSLLTGPLVDKALRWFAIGVLPLALLVAIIAVTGLHFLEAASPARTLGITFPWKKTAGVPRSFGEQGIVISMALSYTLVHWNRLRRSFRWSLLGACFVLVAAGQSRNIFLGTFVVLLTWFMIVRPGRTSWLRPALISSGAAVLVMQQVLPYLMDTELGRDVVGQGIFQRNVESRFTLFNGAARMIADSPFRSILGWSHEDWRSSNLLTVEAGVHNFFASSLLFLGLIGGSLTIWALFIRPLGHAVALCKSNRLVEDQQLRVRFVVTAGTGVLVSLNFYEGFFSLALGLYIAIAWQLLLGRDSPDRAGSVAATVRRNSQPFL